MKDLSASHSRGDRLSHAPDVAGQGMGGGVEQRPPVCHASVPIAAEMAVDVGSALASASCAAPFILTIDKAVVQAMAGTSTLGSALWVGFMHLLRRPHALLGHVGFWMTVGVYGATYTTANLVDTICERRLDSSDPKSAWIHGSAKLLCTTAVNMGSGVAKDAAFARMFGANATSTAPTPLLTYGFFALRDMLTIAAGFTVPPHVTSALVSSGTLPPEKAAPAAQVLSPIGMQIFCSPLHLGALNFYNMPSATTAERVADVCKTLPQATLARMFRFCSAYGMGGLVNKHLLKTGRERLAVIYGDSEPLLAATLAEAGAVQAGR